MDSEIDLSTIQKTQQLLGKHVKKPALTEKLLTRPPFRFLQDIIVSILKSTGFFEGLFDPQELEPGNIKDKESKILFLSKVISVLSFATGEKVDVNPAKIIAGLEAEKTNGLLQLLGKTLDEKVSSREAVAKYKQKTKERGSKADPKKLENHKSPSGDDAGTKPPKPSKSNEKTTVHKSSSKEETSKSKTSETKRSTSKDKISESKKRDNSKDILKNEKSSTRSSTQLSIKRRDRSVDKGDKKVSKSKQSPDKPLKLKAEKIESENTIHIDELKSEAVKDEQKVTEVTVEPEIVKEISEIIPPSIDKQTSGENEILTKNNHETIDKSMPEYHRHLQSSKQPNSVQSSPNVRKNSAIGKKLSRQHTALARTSSMNFEPLDLNLDLKRSVSTDDTVHSKPTSARASRVPTARPSAPRTRSKLTDVVPDDIVATGLKVKVIAQSKGDEKEEEDGTLLMELVPTGAEEDPENEGNSQPSSMHGHLVQQILDTQKEFDEMQGKKRQEWDVSALRAWSELTEETRTSLLGLARAAAPLGRLLQMSKHHADAMRRERASWIAKLKEANAKLEEHKSAHEKNLIPLNAKLKQVEGELQEKQEMMDDLKARIHRNAQRIDKLLDNC